MHIYIHLKDNAPWQASTLLPPILGAYNSQQGIYALDDLNRKDQRIKVKPDHTKTFLPHDFPWIDFLTPNSRTYNKRSRSTSNLAYSFDLEDQPKVKYENIKNPNS